VTHVKIAIEELAGCSGCTIAVLDLHEAILDVIEKAEIVYSPVIMDVKEPPPDIDIAFVTGAVRNRENEERLRTIRAHAKKIVALGTCACYGFREVDTVRPDGVIPTEVPAFLYRAFGVGDVVKIDYYIPGCPPKENRLREILLPLLSGDRVSLARKSICSECDRKMGPIEDWSIKRRSEGEPERDHCMLGQGYLCLGPVTFNGCGAACPAKNIPCHGCNGPSLDIIREPCRDIFNMMVRRISDLTDIPEKEVSKELYDVAHTMYAFTIGSLVMEDKEISKIRDLIKERSK
jgi:F420-non-reducing hydrogenase small subunit